MACPALLFLTFYRLIALKKEILFDRLINYQSTAAPLAHSQPNITNFFLVNSMNYLHWKMDLLVLLLDLMPTNSPNAQPYG